MSCVQLYLYFYHNFFRRLYATGAPYVCLSITEKIRSESCLCAGTPSTQLASTYGSSNTPPAQSVESPSGSCPRESGSCSRCSAQQSGLSIACKRWTPITVAAWQTVTGIHRDRRMAEEQELHRRIIVVLGEIATMWPLIVIGRSKIRQMRKWRAHRADEHKVWAA